MKCIVNGKIVLCDRVLTGMAIIFGDKIEKIVDEAEVDSSKYEIIDAEGNFVAPGLIDMHSHGYLGADVSDGDEEGIRKIAQGIINLRQILI